MTSPVYTRPHILKTAVASFANCATTNSFMFTNKFMDWQLHYTLLEVSTANLCLSNLWETCRVASTYLKLNEYFTKSDSYPFEAFDSNLNSR